MNLTDREIITFMGRLREEGYAIVVLKPEEIQNVKAEDLEYHLILKASELINVLKRESEQ